MKEDEHLQGDDAQLAAMGHKPELQRNYSTLWAVDLVLNIPQHANRFSSMLGLAFAVLNVCDPNTIDIVYCIPTLRIVMDGFVGKSID